MVDWQQVCVVSWQAVGRRGGGKAKRHRKRETEQTEKYQQQRKINRDSQPADPNHHSFIFFGRRKA